MAWGVGCSVLCPFTAIGGIEAAGEAFADALGLERDPRGAGRTGHAVDGQAQFAVGRFDRRGGGSGEVTEPGELAEGDETDEQDDPASAAGQEAERVSQSLRGARPYIPRVRDARAVLSAPSPALRRRLTVGDASWE